MCLGHLFLARLEAYAARLLPVACQTTQQQPPKDKKHTCTPGQTNSLRPYLVCCAMPHSPVKAFLSRLSAFKSRELHWGGKVPGMALSCISTMQSQGENLAKHIRPLALTPHLCDSQAIEPGDSSWAPVVTSLISTMDVGTLGWQAQTCQSIAGDVDVFQGGQVG